MDGVTSISNYISTNDKTIAGRTVPTGSWIKELMITDPDIIEMVKSNKINGVSPNFRLHENPVCIKELKNIKGNLFYNKDIQNKECMNPIFLSLVDEPANEYGLEVYSYDKYLMKTRNPIIGGKSMSNKFKEMLKGFGESIVNYADEMEDTNPVEPIEAVEPIEGTELTKADEPVKEKEEPVVEEEVVADKKELEKTVEALTLQVEDLLKRVEELEGEPEEPDEDEEATAGEADATAEPETQKSKQPQIRVKEEKLDDVELEKQNTPERVNHLGFPIRSTAELAKNKFNF